MGCIALDMKRPLLQTAYEVILIRTSSIVTTKLEPIVHEPMTSVTWVFCHNHYTKVIFQVNYFFSHCYLVFIEGRLIFFFAFEHDFLHAV